MNDKLLFLCRCGWKLISSLKDIQIKELKNDTLSNRKFRCPSCGFAISPSKMKDPQADIERAKKEKEMTEDTKKWLEESIEKQINFVKEVENAEDNNDQ
jgi:histone acetyltransferase (RNA polymerase elongator complex component)